MSYLFRLTVSILAAPLMITLMLLIVAAILRWRGRRRASLITVVSSIVLLYLCSLTPVTQLLLIPLESPYHPLDDAHLPQGIAGIAVLGAAYSPRGGPITAEFSSDGLERVAEGVRLAKHYGSNVRLVLSGGVPPGYGFTASARGYAIFAREMGIDPARVVVQLQSLNTADEARNISKLFGDQPFLLVTSAYHMRRSMLLFERAGGHAIPAPTAQRTGPHGWLGIGWLPNSNNLYSVHVALHEYLGILAMSAGLG